LRALAAKLQDRGTTLRSTLLSRGLIGGRGTAVLDAYADLQRCANAFLADGCEAVAAAGARGAGPLGDSDGGGAAYRFVIGFVQELEKAGLNESGKGDTILLHDPLALFGVEADDGRAQLLSLSLAATLEGRLAPPDDVPDCFLTAEGIRSGGGALACAGCRATGRRLLGVEPKPDYLCLKSGG
jgi:hypothetical protein